jgi:hypothetical protein
MQHSRVTQGYDTPLGVFEATDWRAALKAAAGDAANFTGTVEHIIYALAPASDPTDTMSARGQYSVGIDNRFSTPSEAQAAIAGLRSLDRTFDHDWIVVEVA